MVFLSGDRHVRELYRQPTGALSFLRAHLQRHHPSLARHAEAGPNRLGELAAQQHYGVVDIDWGAATIRLALKDIHGAVKRSQLIQFSELKAKR